MSSPSYCRSHRHLWRVWALELRRARPIWLLGNRLGFRFHQRCGTRLVDKGKSFLTKKMRSFRAISVNVLAVLRNFGMNGFFSQRISVLCSFNEGLIRVADWDLDSRLEHRFIFADIQLWCWNLCLMWTRIQGTALPKFNRGSDWILGFTGGTWKKLAACWKSGSAYQMNVANKTIALIFWIGAGWL